jgi:hypothetical protein
MDGNELIGLFDLYVPEAFLEALAAVLLSSYRRSFRWCGKQFPEEEARDLRPYVRRCMIDARMRQLAQEHSIRGTAEWNIAKNVHHTKIVAGRIVMTASAVDDPRRLPRQADFRDGYARDNQPLLPAMQELEPPPDPDAPLYAILCHGPSVDNPSLPAFADIRFPLPGCLAWAPGRIRLFERYPNAAQAKHSFQEEKIEDQILGQLKPNARKKAKREKNA